MRKVILDQLLDTINILDKNKKENLTSLALNEMKKLLEIADEYYPQTELLLAGLILDEPVFYDPDSQKYHGLNYRNLKGSIFNMLRSKLHENDDELDDISERMKTYGRYRDMWREAGDEPLEKAETERLKSVFNELEKLVKNQSVDAIKLEEQMWQEERRKYEHIYVEKYLQPDARATELISKLF